jgi:hypothetical protein
VRRVLAIFGLLAALAAPALAEEPDANQIYGLKLGQRAPDPSDVGGLEKSFGPVIAKSLKGLMLVETGAPHYLLDLGENRMLGVWFDNSSSNRPIYWLDLTWPELEESIATVDPVDIEIKPRHLVSLHAYITIDRSLPSPRRAEIMHDINAHLEQHPPEGLPANDPYYRLELLGDGFRGRMASHHRGGDGRPFIGVELFDGAIAYRALHPQ